MKEHRLVLQISRGVILRDIICKLLFKIYFAVAREFILRALRISMATRTVWH